MSPSQPNTPSGQPAKARDRIPASALKTFNCLFRTIRVHVRSCAANLEKGRLSGTGDKNQDPIATCEWRGAAESDRSARTLCPGTQAEAAACAESKW